MQLPRIAVSTDFSESSRVALPVAASLAHAFSTKLFVVHQAAVPAVVSAMEANQNQRGRRVDTGPFFDILQRKLAGLVSKDLAGRDIDCEPRLLRDISVEAFVGFLDTENISLLVLAAHGASGPAEGPLGSYTEKILRIATCPVLVYRAPPSDEATRADGFAPKRIYVATDLSQNSEPALIQASSWANTFGATLLLHSVVEKPGAMFGYSEDMFEGWWDYEQSIHEEIQRKLEEAIREHGQGIEIQKSVTVGRPTEEILREITACKPDLVVTGTHGRAGVEDYLLGSVSRKVAARADCPVMVVRPEEKE